MWLDPCRFEVVDDQMAAVLRGMTTSQRLAIANRMWVSARKAIQQILIAEHPEWSKDQIERETARRMSHGAV